MRQCGHLRRRDQGATINPASAGQKVMIHVLALAYFLTIIARFVVITLSLLLYARFASPAYLHWALIMLGGTLLIMAKAVTHYLRLAGSGTYWYLLLSFMLFGLSGELLLGYGVPLIAHGVTGIRISPGRGVLHHLVVAVLGAQVVIEGLTEDDIVAATRTVTEQNQREVIRAFLATGSIVLPIMLFSVLAALFLPNSVALREAPIASLQEPMKVNWYGFFQTWSSRSPFFSSRGRSPGNDKVKISALNRTVVFGGGFMLAICA